MIPNGALCAILFILHGHPIFTLSLIIPSKIEFK